MARPDSSIRVNILIIWALSGYYPDAACRSPYRRGDNYAPVDDDFGQTARSAVTPTNPDMALVMIPALNGHGAK